jgi:hypothetical protein
LGGLGIGGGMNLFALKLPREPVSGVVGIV